MSPLSFLVVRSIGAAHDPRRVAHDGRVNLDVVEAELLERQGVLFPLGARDILIKNPIGVDTSTGVQPDGRGQFRYLDEVI